MRHCPHCGAEVADALSGPETAINCLRCDGVLEAHAVGDYSIPVCPRCGGVWLHKQTFHDICKQVDLQRAVLEFGFPEPKAPLPEGKPHKTYIPCPECGKLMNHKAFAHGSRVIIDYCRNHGVWLDRQELHGIAEFIKKDGMRRHHEWAMTELRGRESQLRFTPPSPMPGDDPSAKDSLTQNDPHKMELAHLRREIETRQSIEPLQWIFKQIFGTF
jgi:Zn-finger nucleic acid-binding protein